MNDITTDVSRAFDSGWKCGENKAQREFEATREAECAAAYSAGYGRGFNEAKEKFECATPPAFPNPVKVILNAPATIIFWEDGTKTVVKCNRGGLYEPEKGIAYAICKKALGNSGRTLNNILRMCDGLMEVY